ncbi:carbohydrate sulfotransferase 6-like [Girardinichthys multiradiatus]|uniref:carbohydrate sulfotransferase 6-like n=1 Tax=Girardinichthys multiradiatus TaxID=208333 RepID=UPI001FADBD7F|nr:carbohydrate sulfotransferase 6-like [Girardinichthys multiradiatus]
MTHHFRVNFKTTILLVILQGAVVVLFYSWYASVSPHHSAPPEGKVHILLLSSWRSGSSFMGQVFSQHPSVFYLMEPAWHVWIKNHKSGASVLRVSVRDLLWSLYKCDFSVMNAYLPENPHLSSLFMWARSQALCSPPACTVKSANETQCHQECHTQSLKKAEEACHTYTHVVLKETRFFELESLYPLLQDPNLNLRVVHLVRDPRAVMQSREQSAYLLHSDSAIVLEQRNVPDAEKQYKVIQEICRSHLHIYGRAIFDPPPFLEGCYKLVRFEDVARNPLTELNNIYEFAGLKMTSEVEEWIHNMTHGKGKGSWNEAFKITSRNAAEVSQAWRTVLPHSKVRRIQEVCKGAMLLLGYRTVDSEEEQKRLDIDLSVPGEP